MSFAEESDVIMVMSVGLVFFVISLIFFFCDPTFRNNFYFDGGWSTTSNLPDKAEASPKDCGVPRAEMVHINLSIVRLSEASVCRQSCAMRLGSGHWDMIKETSRPCCPLQLEQRLASQHCSAEEGSSSLDPAPGASMEEEPAGTCGSVEIGTSTTNSTYLAPLLLDVEPSVSPGGPVAGTGAGRPDQPILKVPV